MSQHLLLWLRPSSLEVLRRRFEQVKSTLDATPVSLAQLRAVAGDLDPWPQAASLGPQAAENDRMVAIDQLRNELAAARRSGGSAKSGAGADASDASPVAGADAWDADAEDLVLQSLREETGSSLAQAKLRVKAVRALEASEGQPRRSGDHDAQPTQASGLLQPASFPRRVVVPVLAELLFDMALRVAARAAEGVAAPYCATSATYHSGVFLDVQAGAYSNQRVAAVTFRVLAEDKIEALQRLPLPELIQRCAAASAKTERSWTAASSSAAAAMSVRNRSVLSPSANSGSPSAMKDRPNADPMGDDIGSDNGEDEEDTDAELLKTRHFPFLRLAPPAKGLLLNTLIATQGWSHAGVNPRNGQPPPMVAPSHEVEEALAACPMDAIVAAALIWWRASPVYEACHAAALSAFNNADINDVDAVSWSEFTEYVTEYFLYGGAGLGTSASNGAIKGSTSFIYERQDGLALPPDTRMLAGIPGYPHAFLSSTRLDTNIVDVASMKSMVTLDCGQVVSCCAYSAPGDLLTEVLRREAAIAAEKFEHARQQHGLESLSSSVPSVVAIPDKYFEWLGPPPPRRNKSRRGVDSLPVLILLTNDLHLHIFRPTDEPITVVSEYGSVEARRRSSFGSEAHLSDRRVVPAMKRVRCDSTPRCLAASTDTSANDGRVFMGDGFGAVTAIDMRMLLLPGTTFAQCCMARALPHSKSVTGIIPVPHQSSLLTASLDGYICLLDDATLVATRRFVAQPTGVRAVRYCPAANVVVTMGFGTTANAFVGLGRGRHFTLFDGATPHLTQLAAIEISSTLGQIITVDVSGLMKVWSLTEHKCLHSTDLGPKQLVVDDETGGGGSTAQVHIQTKHRVGLDFKSQLEALLEAGAPDLSIASVKSVVLCARDSGARVVVCGHEHQAAADFVTTTQLARAHLAPVIGACSTADGKLLVTCTAQEVRVWSLADGALRAAIPLRYLTEAGATGDITAVGLDGALLRKIFVGTSTGDVVALRTSSGKPIKVFSMGAEERRAAQATLPHGASLAVSLIGYDETTKGRTICVLHADNTVRLYSDVGESRRPFQYLQLDKRRSAQTSAAYSAAMRLVSSCNATGDVSIIGTETVTRTMVHELSHSDETRAQCFLSPYPALAVADVKGCIVIVQTRAGLQHEPVTTSHRPPTLCTIGHWSIPSNMVFCALSFVLYVADADGCVAAYHLGGLIHALAADGLRPTSLLRKFQPCARVRVLAASNSIDSDLLPPGCDEPVVPPSATLDSTMGSSSSMVKLVGVLDDKYHATDGTRKPESQAGATTPYGAVTALSVVSFPQCAAQVAAAWGTASPIAGAVAIGFANGTMLLTSADLTTVLAELVDNFPPIGPSTGSAAPSPPAPATGAAAKTTTTIRAAAPKPLSASVLDGAHAAVEWESDASPVFEPPRHITARAVKRAYSVQPNQSDFNAGTAKQSIIFAHALAPLTPAQLLSEKHLAHCEEAFMALFDAAAKRHGAALDNPDTVMNSNSNAFTKNATMPFFALTQPSTQNFSPILPFYAGWSMTPAQAAAVARAERFMKLSSVTKSRLWWEQHRRQQQLPRRSSAFGGSASARRSSASPTSSPHSRARLQSQVPLTEDGGFDLDALRAQLVMTPENDFDDGAGSVASGAAGGASRRRSSFAPQVVWSSGGGGDDPLELPSPLKPSPLSAPSTAPRRPSAISAKGRPTGPATPGTKPLAHRQRSIGFAFDSSFLARQDSFGAFLRGGPESSQASDETPEAPPPRAASSRLSLSSVGGTSGGAGYIQSPGTMTITVDAPPGLMTSSSSGVMVVKPPTTLVANVASVKARQSVFGQRVAATLFGGAKDPSSVKQKPDFIKQEKLTVVSVVADGESIASPPARERSVRFDGNEDTPSNQPHASGSGGDSSNANLQPQIHNRAGRLSLKAVCDALQAGLRIAADRRKSGIDGNVEISGAKRPAPPKPTTSMPRGASEQVARHRLFDHPQLFSAEPVAVPPLDLPYRDVTQSAPTSSTTSTTKVRIAPTASEDDDEELNGEGHDEDEQREAVALLNSLGTSPLRDALAASPRNTAAAASAMATRPKKIETTATHRRLVGQWRRMRSSDDGGVTKQPLTAQEQLSARHSMDMAKVASRRQVSREL